MKKMVSLALGASVAAIAAGTASPAAAQCRPDPAVANATTTCTGTDADGLRVAVNGTTVNVAQGATVTSPTNGAITYETPSGSSSVLNVSGAVRGVARPGVDVLTNSSRFGNGERIAITVAAGGSITGTDGLAIGALPRPGAFETQVTVTVDNAGTIAGTTGVALRTTGQNASGFEAITNRAGGRIGAIDGRFTTVVNAGVLDGGANAALNRFTNGSFDPASITNTGRITSAASPGATLSLQASSISLVNGGEISNTGGGAALSTFGTGSLSVTNSGTIASGGTGATLSVQNINGTNSGTIRNTGTGPALQVNAQGSLTNAAGGVIASAGPVAIRSSSGFSLTNQGLVTGSVVLNGQSFSTSTIDNRTGTIEGGVSFGSGNDRLFARLDAATGRVGGIAGAIDGGAGTDAVSVAIDGNATLNAGAVPTNFERLEAQLTNAPRVELATGFNATGGTFFSGSGVITNRAALSSADANTLAASGTFSGTSTLSVVNEGSIAVSSTQTGFGAPVAVSVFGGTFDNRGTITAAGGAGGISVSNFASGGTVVPSGNSGRITAAGTAASVSGAFANSGTIQSTGGVGLVLSSGGTGVSATNGGAISGATDGVTLQGGTLENSGSVTGQNGVRFSSGGVLVNTATGVVTGSARAIASDGFSFATMVNAGRIEGLVDTGGNAQGNASDRFVDNGGTVLGAIRLGGGDDLLVTDFGGAADRPLAGATGGVDAGTGFDTLRYRVRGEAGGQVAGTATFEAVGYELIGGATLTLTAPAAQNRSVGFGGEGRVDLTADLSQTNRTVLDLSQQSTERLLAGGSAPVSLNRQLDVVSRGALSFTVNASPPTSQATAVLAGYSRFENAGRISVTQSGTTSLVSAIGGNQSFPDQNGQVVGGRVVNSGVIDVAGTSVAGVVGALELNNTGRITATGGTGASGVVAVRTVVNGGVIDTSGTAVSFNGFGGFTPDTLVNSGTITSAGVAVRARNYGTVIENRAGGTITGRVAIAADGGAIVNAGTITGNVQLDVASFGGITYAPGAFVSVGGTVNGNVIFGAGEDVFLQQGEGTGVSGRIDGGDGFDIFGRSYGASATVALGAPGGVNFEGQYVQARGADTTVTVTSEAAVEGDLFVGGDGRVVNRANVNGTLYTGLPLYFAGEAVRQAVGGDLTLAEVRNEGTIAAFRGDVRRFDNAGTIGLPPPAEGEDPYEGELVSVDGTGEFAFVNSGTITRGGAEIEVEGATRVTIENGGTFGGELSISAYADGETPGVVTLSNTGAITSADEGDATVSLYAGGGAGASVTFDNLGRIAGTGLGGSAVVLRLSEYDEEERGDLSFAVTNGGSLEANAGGVVYDYRFGSERYLYTSPASGLAIVAGGPASGTVVNTAAGRISATGERSAAVGVIGTALDLTNAGVITGTAGTELDPADELARAAGQTFLAGAIHAYSAFGDVVRNSGTIAGSVDLGFGDDRIENRGLIDGAVFLRAGDDTYLQGAGGSLTGVVDGGEGQDLIAVDAAGGVAVAGERFANFERLMQSGAGVASYSGTFAVPTLELVGGTARVEAGRRFATAGAVAVTGSDAAEGVEVAGVLAGAVSLGAGDDLFAEIGEGRATGPVDGGAGVDLYRVTLAGDREGLSANTGFERLGVDGAGTLSLTLGQDFETAALSGAGLDVRLGGFAIGAVEGSAGAERFAADGDVARVSLGDGDDAVRLSGARFAGLYEGGAGNDVLRLSGEGPATLSGAAAGFETVAVDSGALTVTGAIGGTTVSFGDGAQAFAVADGGRAQGAFDLSAGDDRFRLSAGGLLSGSVAGGAGRDAAAISLAGDRAFGANTLTGFELLSVDGAGTLSLTLDQSLEAVALSGAGLDVRLNGFAIGAVEGSAGAERFTADGDVARVSLGAGDDLLSLSGATLAGRYDGGAGADTLRLVGAATLTGQAIGFETLALEQVTALTVRGVLSEAGERLMLGDGAQTIVNAGRIGGSLDFGGGDDVYQEVAGAALGGAVAGGAGVDLYRVTLAGDRSGLSTNTGFERLAIEGSGTLAAAVEGDYELVTVSGATLSAPVRFGGGNNRLAIAGGYQGSVSGGAGSDTIEVSGGSEARPVAFGSIAEVEAFRMTGGFATLSGSGALGSVDLSGGRLVGLAGSTMSASAFNVGPGATFGSAGTVNGNVALGATSVSVFEITPAASDRLVVNGALSIANGATLQIVPTGQLQPGASLDLITASGGITGAFTNVVKPESLFGFLVQQGGRLSLLGQFRNDASFSGQVGSTIDYANSVLVGGRANAALLAAAPGLVGANGTSNAQAFALLAPEAYASARQAAVEQGLTLADAGRGSGFANRRAEPGLFTFGQFAADQRTLRADGTRGTARAEFGGYGLFGGLGYAGADWSLGGFVGYLDGRQRLDGRGATTELEGAAFGVHGRADIGAFGLTATAAYAATEADTRRALPGGSAQATYDLTNLTLDVAATYDVAIGGEWSLKPRIGGTVVRVERDRVAETGSAAFAAQVAADEDTAAFVDGALTAAKTGTVRPFATLGLRYQAAGRDSLALTGFGGGGLGLVVEGAERARVLGTAALGVEADLKPGVTLFSAVAAERGEDDRRESARIGLSVAF